MLGHNADVVTFMRGKVQATADVNNISMPASCLLFQLALGAIMAEYVDPSQVVAVIADTQLSGDAELLAATTQGNA
jgi:hypothetical protein